MDWDVGGGGHEWYNRRVSMLNSIFRSLLGGGLALCFVAAPVVSAAAEPEAATPKDPPPPQEMGVVVIKAVKVDAEVKIDGEAVGTTPVPGPWTLSAGSHTVEVDGKVSKVSVTAGGRHVLNFGTERVAPERVAPAPVRESRIVHTGPGFSLTKAGYALGGVGVLALGAGIYFGLDATDLADQASGLDRADAGNSRADQRALSDDAERSAFLSNVSLGFAGAAILGSAAMIVLASDSPLSGKPVYITPTPVGVSVGGLF